MSGIIDLVTIAIDQKMRQSHIDAQGLRGFDGGRDRIALFIVDKDTGGITPTGRSLDSDRLDDACKWAVQLNFDTFELRQIQLAGVEIDGDMLRALERLPTGILLFEHRVFGAAGEEVFERLIQVIQGS